LAAGGWWGSWAGWGCDPDRWSDAPTLGKRRAVSVLQEGLALGVLAQVHGFARVYRFSRLSTGVGSQRATSGPLGKAAALRRTAVASRFPSFTPCSAAEGRVIDG
jgi:hypothetical protein